MKDRNPRASQKNPKSLQTNNMYNSGPDDAIGLNKASGQLVLPISSLCLCPKILRF